MKPLPGVLIQPMEGADLDAVAALENDIAEFPWSRGHFSDCLKAGYSAWVLRADAALVGYAVLMMVVDEGHLLNIGVAPRWQRHGLGRAMLAHMQEEARRHGCPQGSSRRVRTCRRGRRWWRRHGG